MRILIGLLVTGLIGWGAHAQTQTQAHVAVGQIVEHQALDTLRESLKEGLGNQGFVEGKNLTWTYENAQGNPTTAVQISHKLTSLQPSVIVTLSTPMTQAVASATTTIPIVFGAVTDPEVAKLTGHSNITGLTDYVPPQQQLDLIKTILPDLKAIGVLFNSGEANSQKQVKEIKALCDKEGIKVVEATVSKTSDVVSVVKTLIGRVDAILLPTDNTVISALESIVKISGEHKTPVFGSDVDIVRRGALAAYGVDWHESGLALAKMVGGLLNGQSIESLSIQNPDQLLLYINLEAAKKMGISISEDLQKKANKVL
jgi:putative tryptophan/tyrosine transport system substrate-binding protein